MLFRLLLGQDSFGLARRALKVSVPIEVDDLANLDGGLSLQLHVKEHQHRVGVLIFLGQAKDVEIYPFLLSDALDVDARLASAEEVRVHFVDGVTEGVAGDLFFKGGKNHLALSGYW
eukprot:3591759-Rhodomonas_salina.1